VSESKSITGLKGHEQDGLWILDDEFWIVGGASFEELCVCALAFTDFTCDLRGESGRESGLAAFLPGGLLERGLPRAFGARVDA